MAVPPPSTTDAPPGLPPAVPALHALLPRPHLLQRLLAGPSVQLLHGPPGVGKTATLVLLQRHLQACGQPCQWLQASAGARADDLLQAVAPHQAGPPAWLLVDGLHVLDDAQLETVAGHLLTLPAGWRVTLADRRLRGASLHQGLLHGSVATLDSQALRLEDSEAIKLLSNVFTAGQAQQLNLRLSGWPAALRLLSLSPEQGHALLDREVAAPPLPPVIVDYVEQVLLPLVEASSLPALAELAVVQRFPPDLLHALPSVQPLWQTVDSQLAQGLFVQRLVTPTGWLQVHPGVGEVLRTRLRQGQPAHYLALKRAAVCWFTEHRLPAEAVRHALDLPPLTEAAALIERAGAITVDMDDGPDRPLPATLTPEQARELPLLYLSQIYQLLRHGRIADAERAFQQGWEHTDGYTRLASQADSAVSPAWGRIFQAVLLSTRDQPVPDALYQQMLIDLDTHATRHPVLGSSIASLLAYQHNELQRFDQTIAIAEAGLRLQEPKQQARINLFLLLHMGNAQLAFGAVEPACQTLQRAWQQARNASQPDSYELITCQLQYAVALHEADQGKQALSLLLPALERLADTSGWVSLYADSFAAAAACSSQFHGLDAALQVLDIGRRFAQQRQLHRLLARLEIARAREYAMAGELAAARQVLQAPELQQWFDDAGTACPAQRRSVRLPLLLEQARLAVLLGQNHDAAGYLEQAQALDLAQADNRLRLLHAVLSVRSLHGLRRYGQLCLALQHALQLSRDTGLLWRSRVLAPWLREAADWARHGRHPLPAALASHLQQLLDSAPPCPVGNPRDATRAAPHSLSPRECQTMALLAEGCSTKEIARRLGISEGTVKTHRKKIHEKLGVTNRSQAITRARELLII